MISVQIDALSMSRIPNNVGMPGKQSFSREERERIDEIVK